MKTFEDFDPNLGIKTEVHEEDGRVVIAKKWDAEPILKACAEERAVTAGQRWGELRKVGTIPMSELAKMMRQDGSIDQNRAAQWLRQNPAFVTYDNFLK